MDEKRWEGVLASRVDGDGSSGGGGGGMPIKYASENWIWNSYFSTARFHSFPAFTPSRSSLYPPVSLAKDSVRGRKIYYSIPRLNTDVAIVRGNGTDRPNSLKFLRYVPAVAAAAATGKASPFVPPAVLPPRFCSFPPELERDLEYFQRVMVFPPATRRWDVSHFVGRDKNSRIGRAERNSARQRTIYIILLIVRKHDLRTRYSTGCYLRVMVLLYGIF